MASVNHFTQVSSSRGFASVRSSYLPFTLSTFTPSNCRISGYFCVNIMPYSCRNIIQRD